jgi:uncharacterized protein YdeI (YjbR/CyaY-like superfamily)
VLVKQSHGMARRAPHVQPRHLARSTQAALRRRIDAVEDLVCEALCFGWIDTLVKRLDEDRYAIKVTLRTETSKWSDINRKRWSSSRRLASRASGPRCSSNGKHLCATSLDPELPAYIAKAFKTNSRVWHTLQAVARTHRRDFVVWIHRARRPETIERRIRESIELLSAGKKLGLK